MTCWLVTKLDTLYTPNVDPPKDIPHSFVNIVEDASYREEDESIGILVSPRVSTKDTKNCLMMTSSVLVTRT